MGLRTVIQSYLQGRQLRKYQRENEWEGLVPGDVVEYKNQNYMYRGISKNGGPGMPGFPEPMLGAAHPRDANTIYYLRQIGFEFPNSVFGEGAQPAQDNDTGVYIAFLNASRSDLKKVGHIAPDDWQYMVQELKKELAGKN